MLSPTGQTSIYKEIFHRNGRALHALNTPNLEILLNETPTEWLVHHSLDHLSSTGAAKETIASVVKAWKDVCTVRQQYLNDRVGEEKEELSINSRQECAEEYVPDMRIGELRLLGLIARHSLPNLDSPAAQTWRAMKEILAVRFREEITELESNIEGNGNFPLSDRTKKSIANVLEHPPVR